MSKIYFTSDLHFGHENVIRFDDRPFASVEEMDAELIRRWNAKVDRGDLVYVLGDMIWKTKNDEALNTAGVFERSSRIFSTRTWWTNM